MFYGSHRIAELVELRGYRTSIRLSLATQGSSAQAQIGNPTSGGGRVEYLVCRTANESLELWARYQIEYRSKAVFKPFEKSSFPLAIELYKIRSVTILIYLARAVYK